MLWERRLQWLVEWAPRWKSVTSPAPPPNSKRLFGFGCGERQPRRTHKKRCRLLGSFFGVDADFPLNEQCGGFWFFFHPLVRTSPLPAHSEATCGCDVCWCSSRGSWAQSSGRSWTACQPSARVPAVQLTIPLQSHSPAYWSYHSSTTCMPTCLLCVLLYAPLVNTHHDNLSFCWLLCVVSASCQSESFPDSLWHVCTSTFVLPSDTLHKNTVIIHRVFTCILCQ